MYVAGLEVDEKYYMNNPRKKSPLGKEEVVMKTNLDKLRNFHRIGYNPNNMDLIIVGNIPSNIEDLINEYFGSIPVGENTRKELPELKPFKGKIIIYKSNPKLLNTQNPKESSAIIFINYRPVVKFDEDE